MEAANLTKSPLTAASISSSVLLPLSVLAVVLAASFIYWQQALATKTGKKVNLPPGPRPWPLLGNLPHLGKEELHLLLAGMAKIYGPVFTLWMGPVPAVVIANEAAAREAFIQQGAIFASRPQPYSWKYFSGNYRTSLSSPYGPHWQKLRRILNNHVLSPFQISSYGSVREEELSNLIARIKAKGKDGTSPVTPWELGRLAFVAILVRVCFGDQFKEEINQENDKARQLSQLFMDMFAISTATQLGDYFPWARYLPSSKKLYREYDTIVARAKSLLLPVIRERRGLIEKNQLDLSLGKRFVDILLTLEDAEDQLSEMEIMWNLIELMNGGTDTTSGTLEWTLTYLVCDPPLQQRAYQEVQRALGGADRRISEKDLDKLPLIQAIVKEAMRKHCVAVLGVPHATSQAAKVLGYDIPADTTVFLHEGCILNDPAVWGDPDRFRPERFLVGSGADLSLAPNIFSFLPFGTGRRVCPGMTFGYLHLHLFLANLVLEFEWDLPEPGYVVDFEERFLFSMSKKHPLLALARPRTK